MGGKFRDGFATAVIQGAAAEITRAMNVMIDDAVKNQGLSAEQASYMRGLTRLTGMAMRAAANPDDPAHAFAQEFLEMLFGEMAGGGTPLDPFANADQATRDEVKLLALDYSDAVKAGEYQAQAEILNRLTDIRMRLAPNLSRRDALQQVAQRLGTQLDPAHLLVGADGTVAARPRLILSGGSGDEDDRTARILERTEQLRRNYPSLSEAELRALAEQQLNVEDTVARLREANPNLSEREALHLAALTEVQRQRIVEFMQRYEALPEEQRPFALMTLQGEIGANLAALAGTPMTREQQLRALDVALGAAPVTGEATAIYEFIFGRSPASGEEASRVVAAIGVVTAGYGSELFKTLRASYKELFWAAREWEYAGEGAGRWVRKPEGMQDAAAALRTQLGPPPAGMINPEAHHLVGFGRADEDAQKILNQFHITPNEAANGMWLSAEQHALTYGAYEDAYKQWAGKELQKVVDAGGGRTQVLQALEDIKNTLRNLKPGETPPWGKGR